MSAFILAFLLSITQIVDSLIMQSSFFLQLDYALDLSQTELLTFTFVRPF